MEDSSLPKMQDHSYYRDPSSRQIEVHNWNTLEQNAVIIPPPSAVADEQPQRLHHVPSTAEKFLDHMSSPVLWQLILGNALQIGERSDYCIVIGECGQIERHPVHKFILSNRSRYFSERFSKYPEETELKLSNAPLRAFGYFISYIYTDVLKKRIIVEDLLNLIDLAKQYKIPALMEQCIERLKLRVCFGNCLEIFTKASAFGLMDLEMLALQFIFENASSVLLSNRLLKLSNTDLLKIIKSDELACLESDVFKAALRWVYNLCQKGQIGPVPENHIRQDFMPLIPFIRFPLMTAEEVAKFVFPTGVLTPEQLVSIYNYICLNDPKLKISIFSTNPRAAPKVIIKSESTGPIPLVILNTNNPSSIPPPPPEQIQNNNSTTEIVENCNNFIVPEPPQNISINQNNISNATSENTKAVTAAEYPIVSSLEQRTITEILNAPNTFDANFSSIEFSSEPYQISSGVKVPTPAASDISVTSGRSGCNGTPKERATLRKKRRIQSSEDDDLMSMVQWKKNESEDSWDTYLRRWGRSSTTNLNSTAGIKLENFKITNLYPKIIMPAMEEIHLDLKINLEEDPFHRFVDTFDIRKYVFFRKKEVNWKIKDLWGLQIPITIKINGVTMLKMNKLFEKELIMSFQNDAREILSGLKKTDQLNKLSLLKTAFPQDFESFPTKHLQEVLFYHLWSYSEHSLGQFLKKCPNLVALSSWVVLPVCNKESLGVVKLDLTHDLVSGDKLKRISISKTKISFTNSRIVKSGVAELCLDICYWMPTFADNIHLIFPNLQKVSFRERQDRKVIEETDGQIFISTVSVRMLMNLLKISTIQYIRIWGMDWDERCLPPKLPSSSSPLPARNKLRKSNASSEITENDVNLIDTFLQNCGLSSKAVNFYIEKDSKKNSWVGQEWDESEPVDIDDGYWDTVDQMEYNHFNLNKIYDNCETFQNCFKSDLKFNEIKNIDYEKRDT